MQTGPLTQYLAFQLYHAMRLTSKVSAESDIEVLHELRVAIRRCRSLIKLYLPECYALQSVLGVLVKKTNPLREIDVFLAGLDPSTYPKLYKKCTRLRENEYEMIYTPLFVKESIAVLQQLYDAVMGLNPNIPSSQLISIAESYYAKTVRQYHRTDAHTPETALHEIRIRFKISRYALEFLSETSLHREKTKIKACKKMQNHLGAVQDAADQVTLVKRLCKRYKGKECSHLLRARKQQLKNLKKATGTNR
jgi:CHAD domain-containing protein